MRPTHALSIGDEAPDFCVPVACVRDGQRAKDRVCLHDFRGWPVILTFYMAAFTPL